ncbi:MAG TPA: MFS transporter [Nocardioidaceae bacterium]|nr:MFS transporter [Nocardioidaceae bacterium]
MAGTVRYASGLGRGVLTATVLGSGMALLDSTVVNVALRRIGETFGATLGELQWVTNGYLLTLAALILVGGSLGDRYGRRRIFVVGVVWFAVASLACGFAPGPIALIVFRLLQGCGSALLTPGSLAIIQAVFAPADRARAIGAWAGLGSVAAAVGPFLGGWLVQFVSWRWVFWINLPIAALTVWVTLRAVPETADPAGARRFDLMGSGLGVVALGGITFALIEMGNLDPIPVLVTGLIGVAAAVAFIVVERRTDQPMLPTELFASRPFSASNAMTLLVYGALGAMTFFVVLQLQTVLGYGPLLAGVAMLPITVVMILLARRGGSLASKIGPRLPMALGPLVCALGVAGLARVGSGSSYWPDVFPGLLVFAFGLALLVAPLTATVLAAAPDRLAGTASGVNNAVARTGSLLAVAALPAAVGLTGAAYNHPAEFSAGYTRAMWVCAVLLAVGGLLSWVFIPSRREALAPEVERA